MELEAIVLLEIQKCLPGSNLQEGDARPQMPPQIMAGVTLQRPEQPTPAPFTTSAIRRLSFNFGFEQADIAGAGATDNLLCVFGKGLWRISLIAHYGSNFGGPFGLANVFSVDILDPVGTHRQRMVHITPANTDIHVEVSDQFCFDLDGWNLRIKDPGTGGAQTSVWCVFVHGVKLL